MNYLKQINAFWNWRMFNSLTHSEADLYLAILHLANRSLWQDAISIPNSTLLSTCGISDKSSLARIRNRLIQLGLITYRAGKKGSAGEYFIIVLYDQEDEIGCKNTTNNDTNLSIGCKNATNNDTNLPPITPPILPPILPPYIKEKEKENKNEILSAAADENSCVDTSALHDERLERCVRFYEENIGRISPITVQAIADWLGSVDEDLICYAVEEAVTHNKLSWGYISAIIKAHFNAGRITGTAARNAAKSQARSSCQEIASSSWRGLSDDDLERLAWEKANM